MSFVRNFLAATFLLSPTMMSTAPAANEVSVSPDLVIINAVVHTMDEARPRAEAVAILGNRIVGLGSTSEIQALVGPKTRIIDAGGKLLLPGFNDAHVHFLNGGFALASVDLREAKSPEEMARRVGDYARKLPKGRWVLHGNW